MTELPDRAPEAALLSSAAKRRGISAPQLAAKIEDAGVETIRNWLKGYRTLKAGQTAISRPSEFQLAKVAQELGITAGDLRKVGRDDAADELETVSTSTQGEGGDFRYRKPEGISDERWEQIRARGLAYLDGLIDGAAQER